MPSLGEVEGWPLDPVLADQYHRPAAVHCHVTDHRRPSRKSLRGMVTGPPGQHIPPGPDTWTCFEALGQVWTEGQGQFHLPQVPLIPPMIIVDGSCRTRSRRTCPTAPSKGKGCLPTPMPLKHPLQIYLIYFCMEAFSAQ